MDGAIAGGCVPRRGAFARLIAQRVLRSDAEEPNGSGAFETDPL